MKVKVTQKFKDKYTKTWHEFNEILEVSQDRYLEIKKFVKIEDNNEPKPSTITTSKKENKANH